LTTLIYKSASECLHDEPNQVITDKNAIYYQADGIFKLLGVQPGVPRL